MPMGAWTNKMARTPMGVWQSGDVEGGGPGRPWGHGLISWLGHLRGCHIEGVHRGLRGRTGVPMGAWSGLDTYGGVADWGRPRGREGEDLGAHGGMV